MANCPACGCKVSDNAKFCPSCGGRIAPVENSELVPQAPVSAPAEEMVPANWYSGGEACDTAYEEEGVYEDPRPTVRGIYARVGEVLRARPLKLWGMSLLNLLLVFLSCALAAIPIIALPIVFALYVGMEAIYLEGIYGAEPTSKQLFKGFSKSSFMRFVGGMGWMCLWVFIWSLIPIAGVVFGVIKAYSYRFVPYIMLSDPEVDAFEALNRSKEMSYGLKARMFAADALVIAALLVAVTVLVLLSNIDFIGFIFAIVLFVLYIAAIAFLPLFFGLVRACFYDEAEKMM